MPIVCLSEDSEVPPGEEAQVDYGYLGKWTDPVTGTNARA